MHKTIKKYSALLLFFLCCLRIFPADLEPDFSKGPLFGKNMYIPFLIHYNFPSLSARSGRDADFQYHFSFYYIQDAHYWGKGVTPISRIYDKRLIFRDYEGCVGEFGFANNVFNDLQIGADMRVIAYYGGFLDPFMEFFHNTFDFSNGSREYFLQNQLYVNIPNDNEISLFLDEDRVSFGDIDIWGKWTFFENRRVSVAGLGAYKLPTGKLEYLSGSGSPDIGLGLLSDFRVDRFFSFYAQAGIVLPLNQKSYPMFNGLAGLEIHPLDIFSLNVQMNIKTSPISDRSVPWSWNDEYGTYYSQYSLPQTNLLFGFIIRHKDTRFQLYLEEDAITNQGADITFNMMFSQSVNLKSAR